MEESVENQQEKTNVKTKSNLTSISEILKRLIQKIDILSVTAWSKYLYSQFKLTASEEQLQGKTDIRPLQYRTFIFATIQRGLY
jgi:hypothetical protein